MPGTTVDQLRDLLRQQVQAASDEAVHAGGQISAEQEEALERLAHLADLHQATQPPPTRKRWPLALALASALLIVTPLLIARVAETDIELDLTLSSVNFVLPQQQVLNEEMNNSTLGASGLREIRLGREAEPRQASDSEELAMRLSVASDGERQGSITLAPLNLPKGTRVLVRRNGLPRQYRLSLEGTDLKLEANLNGQVEAGGAGMGNKQLYLASPDVVSMQSGASAVDLDLTFPDSVKGSFRPQLPVTDLSFFRIDEFSDTTGTAVRRVSTIISGTLYLASLNDEERKLRPGDAVHFEHSQGEIRTLRLQDDLIDLKFHGRVRGLTIGSDENRRSLMPTWLEWLRARHGLTLLWGTVLYLFGLIVGVLRWWRISV